MKNVLLKTALPVALMAGALNNVRTASAHDVFDLALGAKKGAIDTFKISCDAGADHLFFQIRGKGAAKGPKVNLTVLGPKGGAVTSTDPVTGDANLSPGAKVADQAGLYYLIVSKSKRGRVGYDIELHCEDPSGSHGTQSEVIPMQDQ